VETFFYFLAFLQILLGVYLIWQALQWLGYVRRRLHSDPGFYTPRVAVLCPCKGPEPGLERNLLSLTEFERQNYEIFSFSLRLGSSAQHHRARNQKFQGESQRDHRGNPANSGEKVNNLRVQWNNCHRNLKFLSSPIPTGARGDAGCTISCRRWGT